MGRGHTTLQSHGRSYGKLHQWKHNFPIWRVSKNHKWQWYSICQQRGKKDAGVLPGQVPSVIALLPQKKWVGESNKQNIYQDYQQDELGVHWRVGNVSAKCPFSLPELTQICHRIFSFRLSLWNRGDESNKSDDTFFKDYASAKEGKR